MYHPFEDLPDDKGFMQLRSLPVCRLGYENLE